MVGLTGFSGLVRSADGSLSHPDRRKQRTRHGLSPWQFSLYALSAITVRRHAFLTIAPLANQRTVAFPPQIAGLSALHGV
jgi:hypothetical protein